MIYGYSNLDILFLIKAVSSYKNNDESKVPKQAINPKKLFFKPKNKRVKL